MPLDESFRALAAHTRVLRQFGDTIACMVTEVNRVFPRKECPWAVWERFAQCGERAIYSEGGVVRGLIYPTEAEARRCEDYDQRPFVAFTDWQDAETWLFAADN